MPKKLAGPPDAGSPQLNPPGQPQFGASAPVPDRPLIDMTRRFFVEHPITEAAIRRAFASMAGRGFDAIYVAGATDMFPHRVAIAEQVLATQLPAIALQHEYAGAGVLLSYSPPIAANFARLAHYVHKILKGADPGEIPIEQSSVITLTVNLATARALGITLPPATLFFATEVIE